MTLFQWVLFTILTLVPAMTLPHEFYCPAADQISCPIDTNVDGDVDHLCQGLYNSCLIKASYGLQYFVCFMCKKECFGRCTGEKKHKVKYIISKKGHGISEIDVGGIKDETVSNMPMRFYHPKGQEH